MKDTTIENERRSRVESPSLWQENHGNLLLAFLGAIFLVGASILAFNQNRFVPVGFPDGGAIKEPTDSQLAIAQLDKNSILVKVTGAANDKGAMMVAIYDSSENFNDTKKAVLLKSIVIEEGEGLWQLEADALPKKFAIAAYHDENNDEELNRNRFGIPTERYGFSNNARGLTGPPSFGQAAMERPDGGTTLQIFVR